MKKRGLYLLILTFLVLSFSNVSACIINNPAQLAISFPNGSGINMEVLENYCGSTNCKIVKVTRPQDYKEITFKTTYARKEMIMVARSTKETNGSVVMSLSIKFLNLNPIPWELMPITLNILNLNNITYGISQEDAKNISNISRIANLIYFKPVECKNSYLETGNDEYKEGWILAPRHCVVASFDGVCPKIACDTCEIGSAIQNTKLYDLPLINSTSLPPQQKEPEIIIEEIPPEEINPSENKEFNYGLIIGILIGVIVVLLVALIIVNKSKKKK